MNSWVFLSIESGTCSGNCVLLPNDETPLAPDGYEAVPGTLCEPAQLPTKAAQASFIRAHRTALMLQSDWTQLSDAPLSEDNKKAWRTYRQLLRQITDQPDFPAGTQWPKPPSNNPAKASP